MPHTRIHPSFTFTEERIAQLKAVIPEAFADGSLRWTALREVLGENVEEEGDGAEHFGLFWPGKLAARRLAAIPSRGALRPVAGEGVKENSSRNLFLEGDNLEVLKLLQKAYAGRVKMIYIDPPYNTGNDFVYNDSFTDPLGDYLRKTGQADEKGRPLTTNTKADGRFHSNWLSMMYPRLRLARTLLRDDGIIFVSIDDNEAANLRLLMNEVFGEESFIEQIVWKNKYGSGALTKGFANVHEYVLCYAKSVWTNIAAPLDADAIAEYKNRDGKFSTRGGYVTQPLATTSKDERPNLRYPIVWKGDEIWPEKQWIWSRERTEKAIKNDEIVVNEKDGKFSVRMKQYLRDENGLMRKGKPVSIILGPFNQEGTAEITELLGKGVFEFPKPSALIRYFFSFVVNEQDEKDGLYLDFFAGSCATAHAIQDLNREDGGSRRFICIQWPEPTPEASIARREGYETVADVGKARIRQVGKKLAKQKKPEPNEDLGFCVLRLSESQFRAWENYHGMEPSELQTLFDQAESPLVAGWTPEGLLTEVMLLEGFPLDSAIRVIDAVKGNAVMEVTSAHCGHRLLCCFDRKLKDAVVEGLKLMGEDVFACLDTAVSDSQKLRLADRCNLKTI
jgi:adenine-specific DNA-methyltransferase